MFRNKKWVDRVRYRALGLRGLGVKSRILGVSRSIVGALGPAQVLKSRFLDKVNLDSVGKQTA